jgi:hypothetical protein
LEQLMRRPTKSLRSSGKNWYYSPFRYLAA